MPRQLCTGRIDPGAIGNEWNQDGPRVRRKSKTPVISVRY